MLRILIAAFLLLSAVVQAKETPKFSQDGYRSTLYRSPTPPSAQHAITVDTPALQSLLKQNPQIVLIDVYGKTFLHGRFTEGELHAHLPGSLWLPNTGLVDLSAPWQAYFVDNLAAITAGDLNRALVFFIAARIPA